MRYGKENFNWRGGGEIACAVCGIGFWVKPSHRDKRKTCSRQCAASLAKVSGKYAGSNNPAFGKSYGRFSVREHISLICNYCGNDFERLAKLRRREGTFCSKSCAMASVGKRDKSGEKNPNYGNGAILIGSANPNWRGGKTSAARCFRASSSYKKWRKSVLFRDNFKCVWCGSDKKLEVDHIKSIKTYPRLALTIKNGRTLCKPCHASTESYGRPSTK